MKATVKTLIFYAVILIAGYLFLRQSLRDPKIFNAVLQLGWKAFLPQFLLTILLNISVSFSHKLTVKQLGLNLPTSEWLILGFVNTLSNYLFPFRAGTLVRAMFLKKKYDFQLTHSGSVLVFATFLSIETSLLLGASFIGGLLLFFPELVSEITVGGLRAKSLAIILILSALFIAIIGYMTLYLLHLQKRYHNKLLPRRLTLIVESFAEGAKILFHAPLLLAQIILMQMIQFFIQGARIYFAFLAFNIDIAALGLVFINIVNMLSQSISILPGNLGVQEAIITISGHFSGITLQEGFAGAALIRGAAMLVVFVCGAAGFLWLRKAKKSFS